MKHKEEILLEKLIDDKDLLKTLRDVRGDLDIFLKMEFFLTWKHVAQETFKSIQNSESYQEYLELKSKGEEVEPIRIEIYKEYDGSYIFLAGNINLEDEALEEDFSILLNDNFSKIQIESYLTKENFDFTLKDNINYDEFERMILSEMCDKDYITFLDKEKLSNQLSKSNVSRNKKGMKV